jgi:hypothetical protein
VWGRLSSPRRGESPAGWQLTQRACMKTVYASRKAARAPASSRDCAESDEPPATAKETMPKRDPSRVDLSRRIENSVAMSVADSESSSTRVQLAAAKNTPEKANRTSDFELWNPSAASSTAVGWSLAVQGSFQSHTRAAASLSLPLVTSFLVRNMIRHPTSQPTSGPMVVPSPRWAAT